MVTLVADLPNNPFLAPKDGRCIINELPSELLSHIFTLGWTPERDQEDEEDDFEDVDEGASDELSYSSGSSVSGDDEDGGHSHHGDEHRSRKLPFNVLVSHVCQRWRDVALSNSLLWNHISFVGPPPYERALIYLSRAASAPLALTVDRTVDDEEEEDFSESDYEVDEDEGPKNNDPDLAIITGIMDVIVPHIDHTQTLQIMVSFYPQMHRALEMMSACQGAPMLEELQLYHYEDTDEHETFKWQELREQPFVLFHGNIPRLIHVALWGVHVDWSKEGSPYLTGLTDLELAYHARDVRPSIYEFARIMRSCPDLRTLTLCLSAPAGTPSDWPSGLPLSEDDMDVEGVPFVLPKLSELVLAYLEPNYLLSLLPRFSFPALTSLALDLEDEDYGEVLTYLSSPRSLPQPPQPPLTLRGPGVAGSPAAQRARSLLSNLTSLKIASLPCPDTLVADAYRQLENVTALNLNMMYLGDGWFDLLFPKHAAAPALANTLLGASEVLLPRLETLTCTGIDGGRMRELVRLRAACGRPVKKVLMNQDDDVSEEDELWLGEHLEKFEYFEGSDEEEDVLPVDEFDGFDTDDDGWEDADDDEDIDDEDDDFDDGPGIVILPL
ncbi:hypothetical protein L226DRAFT_332015 [Lentinus tigrinus ALCF2SS1-7]|uniref:Uncharacterized protein n=1 Tax=Lentinus tigrinus ALCF2SS1-6 TaxID=1328759 RepID=A0A5C2SFK0_9APHY|nr:hypothetical protein L227DRAFT_545007 [Lentinus tigrinus ALCF2SS1-6]RPD77783.1 hypothetical protein L226DRAFT_332015 [Lentinus tigrinus ALCF2SS1-7]